MGQQRSDQGRMRFADKQHFPSRPWMLAVCRRRMAGLGGTVGGRNEGMCIMFTWVHSLVHLGCFNKRRQTYRWIDDFSDPKGILAYVEPFNVA